MRLTRCILVRLWALPASAIGLALLPLAFATGGRARMVRGVLEISGGLVTALLDRPLPGIGAGGAIAMTLGHTIIGRDEGALDLARDHEHVHVRQYERWGPFMIPAYLLASAALYVRGGDPYRDNPFEREAYTIADV